jgi:hypothetical protein
VGVGPYHAARCGRRWGGWVLVALRGGDCLPWSCAREARWACVGLAPRLAFAPSGSLWAVARPPPPPHTHPPRVSGAAGGRGQPAHAPSDPGPPPTGHQAAGRCGGAAPPSGRRIRPCRLGTPGWSVSPRRPRRRGRCGGIRGPRLEGGPAALAGTQLRRSLPCWVCGSGSPCGFGWLPWVPPRPDSPAHTRALCPPPPLVRNVCGLQRSRSVDGAAALLRRQLHAWSVSAAAWDADAAPAWEADAPAPSRHDSHGGVEVGGGSLSVHPTSQGRDDAPFEDPAHPSRRPHRRGTSRGHDGMRPRSASLSSGSASAGASASASASASTSGGSGRSGGSAPAHRGPRAGPGVDENASATGLAPPGRYATQAAHKLLAAGGGGSGGGSVGVRARHASVAASGTGADPGEPRRALRARSVDAGPTAAAAALAATTRRATGVDVAAQRRSGHGAGVGGGRWAAEGGAVGGGVAPAGRPAFLLPLSIGSVTGGARLR